MHATSQHWCSLRARYVRQRQRTDVSGKQEERKVDLLLFPHVLQERIVGASASAQLSPPIPSPESETDILVIRDLCHQLFRSNCRIQFPGVARRRCR